MLWDHQVKPFNMQMVLLYSLQLAPFDPVPCFSFDYWMMMLEPCINPRTFEWHLQDRGSLGGIFRFWSMKDP